MRYLTPRLIMITSRSGCPHCDRMETMLNNAGLYPTEIFVDDILELFNKSHRTIPQLYYKGKCLGGADDLEKHNSSLNTLKLYIKQGPDLK